MSEIGSSSTPTTMEAKDDLSVVAMEEGETNQALLDSIREEIHKSWDCVKETQVLRVPDWLRSTDKTNKLFEPSLVSIGPYHRGKPHLQLMEVHKWHSLDCFFARNENGLAKCLKAVKELESSARSCYGDFAKSMSSDDFMKMMIADGCFIIIALIIFSWKHEANLEILMSFPIFSMTIELDDLLLMENQIPLDILRTIVRFFDPSLMRNVYDFQVLSRYWNDYTQWSLVHMYLTWPEPCTTDETLLHLYYHSLVEGQSNSKQVRVHYSSTISLCCNYIFSCLLRTIRRNNSTSKRRKGKKNYNRSISNSRSKSRSRKSDNSSNNKSKSKDKCVIHSATKLQERGVVFKKIDLEFQEEITFLKNGVLKLPCISIDDAKTMNLLAFEQSEFKNKYLKYENFNMEESRKNNIPSCTPISDMIYFIASMIRTSKDLEVLEYYGIIDRTRSSEDALSLFSMLRINLQLDIEFSYLVHVCQDINKFIKSRRIQWWAKLRKDYFSNPWSVISLLAQFSS